MTTGTSGLRTEAARRIDLYCLVLVLGYGLCRSLNNLTYPIAVASVVGVFPLTGDDLHFSIIASSAIMLGAAVCAVFGWRSPRATLARSGAAAILALGAINLFAGLGFLDHLPVGMVDVALPALFGLASVLSNVAWLVPFVNLGPRRCLVTLTTSVLASAAICLLLGRLPLLAQCISLAVAGAGCALLFACLGAMDPGASDKPASCTVEPAEPGIPAFKRTVRVLLELWSPLVIYTVSTCLVGFVSAFLAFNPLDEGSLPKTLAVLAGALFMALLAIFANRIVDLRRSFQFAFPAMAVALGVLPFLGPSYGIVFNTLLNFLFTVASISALFLFIETVRARRAPAVAVFASMMFVVRVCLVVSLFVGIALGTRDHQDELMHMLMLALVSTYVLVFALMMLLRAKPFSFRGVSMAVSSDEMTYNQETPDLPEGELGGLVELTSEDVAQAGEKGTGTGAGAGAGEGKNPRPAGAAGAIDPADEPGSLAHIEKRSHELAAASRLTPREREIVVLLARGRTAPYIATELGLSSNTVRSYVQSAYAKLKVHSKQELIDLLEE